MLKNKQLLSFLLLGLLLITGCKKNNVDLSLIPVMQNDKWGYIDKEGKLIINYQFKNALPFIDGVALVANDEHKWGFITEDGKYTINPVYQYAIPFSEDLAPVVMENGTIKYINKKGEIKISLPNNIAAASAFKEGLAVIINDEKKFGYIDNNGTIKIPCQFEEANPFYEDLACVKSGEKYGFIDKNGKIIINYQYKNAERFSEGLAGVAIDDKWGFIDKEGKFRINPQFKEVKIFLEGVCAVKADRNWGYIDKDGKYTINSQFEQASGFAAGYASAVTGKKSGLIDKDGKFVVNPYFEYLRVIDKDLIVVEGDGGKYGIINTEGKYTVNAQFDLIPSELIRLASIDGNLFSNNGYNFTLSDYVDVDGLVSKITEKSGPTSMFGFSKNSTRKEYNKLTNIEINRFASVSFVNGLSDYVPGVDYDNNLIYEFIVNVNISGNAVKHIDDIYSKLKSALPDKIKGRVDQENSKAFVVRSSEMLLMVSKYSNTAIRININFRPETLLSVLLPQ